MYRWKGGDTCPLRGPLLIVSKVPLDFSDPLTLNKNIEKTKRKRKIHHVLGGRAVQRESIQGVLSVSVSRDAVALKIHRPCQTASSPSTVFAHFQWWNVALHGPTATIEIFPKQYSMGHVKKWIRDDILSYSSINNFSSNSNSWLLDSFSFF